MHGFYRVHDSGISRDLPAQRRRAEYLIEKLKIRGYTFRQFKTRGVAKSLVWNAFDLVMTLQLIAREQWQRRRKAPVPMRSRGVSVDSSEHAL